MSIADIRKSARQAVHTAFAVPILFYPAGTRVARAVQNSLTARLHTKVTVSADALGSGYAKSIDATTRVVFNADELAAEGIVPKAGDVIEFPDYSIIVRLDMADTTYASGPVAVKWSVSQMRP